MLNLPHSLIPDLGQELGKRRYILVGNKVDELPINEKNYLERWKQALIHAAHERSHIEESSIVYVSLTSALTGYGINQLIDFLLSRKFNCAAPIYILGSTNVGKSSIFNRLLLSDVCKSEARETIHRATISDWPGTTAGLLKFPLVLMNSAKRGLREEAKFNARHLTPNTKENEYVASCGFRYLKAQPIVTSDQRSYTPLADAAEKAQSAVPNLLNMPTYTRSCGVTEASEVDLTRLQQIYLPKGIQIDTGSWAGDRGYRLLTTFLDPRHFNDRAWCFDTPGFICPDQTLNYLSNKDLQAFSELNSNSAHSKRKAKNGVDSSQRILIVPRTFIMRPGLGLLLGNLGRLDLIQAPGPVYFTTFSTLPVHIVEQTEFEQYVTEHAASLGPGHEISDEGPCGQLPPLKSRVLDPFYPQISTETSSVDVVLSGAGWISVVGISTQNGSTSDEEELEAIESHSSSGQIHLCAWTPGGLGISVRKPPLVPNAVHRRGKRLLFMREFGGDAR
ncbi:nitric oxide associated protein 1 [Clonorchis sinensis]|uniref:Nitric oxide associated protein 1 n=1 Tax=Clonorchis sinensis TaxID=79923 RepID=A0A8T1M805_CLOSI|nr:nitric oxide associated protein 1 [Clonorchis sinensis]